MGTIQTVYTLKLYFSPVSVMRALTRECLLVHRHDSTKLIIFADHLRKFTEKIKQMWCWMMSRHGFIASLLKCALVTTVPLSVCMVCLSGRPDNAWVTGPDGLACYDSSQPSDWEEEVGHPGCLCFLNRWDVCTISPNLNEHDWFLYFVICHALFEQVWDLAHLWTMSLPSTLGNLPSSQGDDVCFFCGKVWPWNTWAETHVMHLAIYLYHLSSNVCFKLHETAVYITWVLCLFVQYHCDGFSGHLCHLYLFHFECPVCPAQELSLPRR